MTPATFPVRTSSEAETRAVGRALATELAPGDVVALVGDLGAGKTRLVQGVVEGLGGDPEEVTSPTFTIAHAYATHPPVYHMDLYRLRDAAEVRDAGLEEYLTGDGICLVEWPERAGALLPAHTLVVRLAHAGGDARMISLERP